MDETYAREPLVSIEEESTGLTVYQLGGPRRVALYGCLTRGEAEAFVAGLRASHADGSYAQGYALGKRDEAMRLTGKLERLFRTFTWEEEP